MGKESRRASRRGRPSAGQVTTLPAPPLQMTVVTSPGEYTAGELLVNDLQLIRSSILYADSIDLISVGATTMRAAEELRKGGIGGALRLFGALSPAGLVAVGSPALPSGWRDLIPALSHVDSWEEALSALNVPAESLEQLRREVVEPLAHAVTQIQSVVSGQMELSGMNELWPAIRRRNGQEGIVRLRPVGIGSNLEVRVEDLAWVLDSSSGLAELMHNWQRLIADVTSNSDNALLLDKLVSGVVHEMQAQGTISVSNQTRQDAAAAAVGAGMVHRLPAFPNAPIDELLDVRNQFDVQLSRYRIAAKRLSIRLNVEVFSDEWADEVRVLWDEEVHPAIVDIEGELTEATFTRELARSLGTDTRLIITGGSALTGYMIPKITVTSAIGVLLEAVGAVGAPVASVVVGAVTRSHAARRAVDRKDLAYLVNVNRELESRRTR